MAIATMEDEYELVCDCDLSNGIISNWPSM